MEGQLSEPAPVARDGAVSERQARARAEILSAAAHVIARRGYHGMSMRELARATGRSPAGLYNYCASKEDVLFDLQNDAFVRLISRVGRAMGRAGGDPAARLYALIYEHSRYFIEQPDVMRVLLHEAAALPPKRRRAVRALKERYFQMARDVVAELLGSSRGASAAKDAAEIERLSYDIFGMINWMHAWCEPTRHGSVSEVATTIWRMAMGGLTSSPPPPVSLDS